MCINKSSFACMTKKKIKKKSHRLDHSGLYISLFSIRTPLAYDTSNALLRLRVSLLSSPFTLNMATTQNQDKQKSITEEKNLAALGVLEEDDEFEEFATEGLCNAVIKVFTCIIDIINLKLG
ncbi:unnamed protein product [Rhizopus microsporus]